MKRFWLGLGVLLGLLAVGICLTGRMYSICRPMWQQLEQAAETHSPEIARSLCAQARDRWEKAHNFLAAVTDHAPMEEIDALFEELEAYTNDRTLYAKCCARLSSCVKAIAEAQAVNWWNIF